ncbi:1-phosphofructokinase family hexose kinase [Jiangella asiatica]|uniref:1-phosphofructokinase family hexose kinase n=1 Tax=Jiangella asiatica TaxID=2530372 RepID=A0A4R5DBS4_9ACTN|nr:1-phosphofructokinase family hexose kinase [Jiangella asiatica]TDE10367.1 1-phosphofructokinase family hexose kinase [Jiangella asiatica]
MNHVVCVTPNPAADVTYEVAALMPGATHRVRRVLRRPGGKGVNVARVLRALDVPATVVVPVGGPTGEWLVDALRAEHDTGFRVLAVPVAAETRRTVTVVDGSGTATALNEPGRPLTEAEWAGFLAATADALIGAAAMTVSGSLPVGAPADLPARLVALARDAGVPAVVDTSGPPLLAAVEAGPDVVKPNAEELAEIAAGDDALVAARRLVALGARRVVVSRGADGLLGVDADGGWHVPAVPGVAGNPTGAGDAAVAALAHALVAGTAWPYALVDAAALGAAAVLADVAGEVDLAAYHRFLPTLSAERIA